MKENIFTDEQVKLQEQLRLLAQKINEDIYTQRSHTFGKIATIVEAIVTDQEQRKAVKDLVSDAVYGPSYWNGIRYQFNQLAKAHGFQLWDDSGLAQPNSLSAPDEPVNEYEKI